jgi:exodeoxyribonuclease-5
MVMKMNLNNEQHEAIKKVINWYYLESDYKQLLTISGGAGVGKTFLAKVIIQCLGLQQYQVVFATPTGKSSEVLRRRNIPSSTIHKAFYSVKKIDGKLRFSKRKRLSSTIKLIVLDELSMINDRIMEDIISFKTPIIGLGDIYQLPPIYGSNKYLKAPDVLLTEIMRQKDDIGILRLATMARNKEYIPLGEYIESKVIRVAEIDDIEKFDIVLCWKNSTRCNLNITIRERLGFNSIYPSVGEKLICLKNNYTHLLEYNEIPVFLVNGMEVISQNTVEIANVSGEYFELVYSPSYINDPGLAFSTRVHRGPFDYYQTNKSYAINGEEPEDVVFLDYCRAITVHKSQADEFDNVLLIDEFKGSSDIYFKWLYTGITRAKKSVTIARYF